MSIYFTATLLMLFLQNVVVPATSEGDQSATKPAGGDAANPNPAATADGAANTNDAANKNSAANTNSAAHKKTPANLFAERFLQQFATIDYSKIPRPIGILAREGIQHIKNGADNLEKNEALKKQLDMVMTSEIRNQFRNALDDAAKKLEETKKKEKEQKKGAGTSETSKNGDDTKKNTQEGGASQTPQDEVSKTATAAISYADRLLQQFTQQVATLDFTKTPTTLNNLAFEGLQQFRKNAENWEKNEAIKKQLDVYFMAPETRKQIRDTLDEVTKKLGESTKKEKEQNKDAGSGETAENGDKKKKTAQGGDASSPVQGSEDKKDGNGPKP